MKPNHYSSIANFINLFVSSFREFFEEGKRIFPFKVVDAKYCPEKRQTIFVIKTAGQNIVIEKAAQELVLDDAFLSGLSPLDSRAITYMACIEKNAPENTIVAAEYSDEHNDMLLHVKDNKNNEIKIMTAHEASKNKSLIKKLTQDDAHRVGYLFGVKSMSIDHKKG
jgi:hypothetical protein